MTSPSLSFVSSRRGFTLIELLTVIAIIAILSGLTFNALSGARERARVTSTVATMAQLNTALVNYMSTHNTYPPMYGYLKLEARNAAASEVLPESDFYFKKPYMAYIRQHGVTDLYDKTFALEGSDTDRDGRISLLEFSPVGNKDIASGNVTFDQTDLYLGNNMASEVSRQLNEETRPFVYVAVNSLQAKQARQYWIESGDWYGETWNQNATNALRNVVFPPPKLDTYVLISVGPSGSTFGIVADPPAGNYDSRHAYYVAALRTYYLATRDLNDNGQLDFEFRARTQGGEGELVADVNGVAVGNQLPDPMNPNNAGPLIEVYR